MQHVKLLSLAILFFIFINNVFSLGSGKSDYSKAKKASDKSNHSEVFSGVIEQMEQFPNSFSQGLDFVEKSMAKQNKFKETFDILLKVLYETPNDSEKILAVINEIEQLYPDIDPSVKKFLSKVKKSSTYALYRVKFNKIMEEGIAFIKEEKYTEAANKFAEGYTIYYSEYEQANKGTSKFSETERIVKSIQESIASFDEAKTALQAASETYLKNLSDFTNSAEAEYRNNFFSAASRVHSLSYNIFQNGNILKNYYLQEVSNNTAKDESFLPFAFRLTLGRDSAQSFEGILGSYEAAYGGSLTAAQELLTNLIVSEWQSCCSKFDFKNNADTQFHTKKIKIYLEELTRNLSLNGTGNTVRFIKSDPEKKTEKDALKALTSELETISKEYNVLISLSSRTDKLENYAVTVEEIHNPNNSIIKKLKNDIDTLQKSIASFNSSIMKIQKTDKNSVVLCKTAAEPIVQTLLEKLIALYIEKYCLFAEVKNKAGRLSIEENEGILAKIEKEMKGVYDKETDMTSFYPYKVLNLIKGAAEHLSKDTAELEKVSAFIKAGSIYYGKNKKINEYAEGIRQSINKLEKIAENFTAYIAKLESNLVKMNLAKSEADFRYNASKNALAVNDFLAARKHIELSREKSSLALAFQEDPDYRLMTDTRLSKLASKINLRENEIVIREVRSHIIQGKKFYFNGQFDSAERTFLLAKNRWHVTNAEPNEEITDWLNIITKASSMRSQRIIPPSAPFYPQMVQLLNNAKNQYLEVLGKKRENKVQTETLNTAREYLKQVLLVYPFNEDARNLNLKIEQLTDPANFKKLFSIKLKNIKKTYKAEPKKAYNELLDLYGIDKTFTGLENLKDEIEIHLGLKLPPPNSAAIAQSKRYTESALKIYKTNNLTAFPIAVQQLDQAIKLDINNTEAVTLKDSIQMRLGGNSSIVLSASDEAKYQKAVLELQKGNNIIAAVLVKQLLQSNTAKLSAKVQALKKRVEAQL